MKNSLDSLKYLIVTIAICLQSASAMPLRFEREEMIRYTPKWHGERFSDGRPKVPDEILRRLKIVSVNQAWQVLRAAGYDYQFERGWNRVHPDGGALVGRAMTVMYMPRQPVVFEVTNEVAAREGRTGNQVSWPVNMLVEGDVYVADVYGKEVGGPIVGASLANAIFANSGNGVVFDGEIRDLTEITRIQGFNSFVRNFNPTAYWASMVMGVNIPTRIGGVTVMPGDVVLGGREGVIFIPPHLAEEVVDKAERAQLRDQFAFQRLEEKKYALNQVYGPGGGWSDDIESDFSQWLRDNINALPVGRAQVEKILLERESGGKKE